MTRIADIGPPAEVVHPAGRSAIVLVCEHASNYIPAALNGLGLGEAERVAHIAWDIGAEAVARRMAEELDAPLVVQRYSRLVYDCNRPPEAAGAMPPVSEVIEIPGNKGLSEDDRRRRTDQIYRPFHAKVGEVVQARREAGISPVLVTVHSFTPVFKGTRRHLDLGVLHDSDSRLADAMLEVAGQDAGYSVARNEPYGPQDGVTHTLNLHRGDGEVLNVMLEVRNDLIDEDAGQARWAVRLAGLVRAGVALVDAHGADQAVAAPN